MLTGHFALAVAAKPLGPAITAGLLALTVPFTA